MKIACVSDMHSFLPKVPKCDICLIAGDNSPVYNHGINFQKMWTMSTFVPWMQNIEAENVVWVKGNHDLYSGNPQWSPESKNGKKIIYLEDESAEVQGFTIFGSPNQLPFGRGWSFNKTEAELEEIYSNVDKADIIISHGPPFGYGDKAPRIHNKNEEDWPGFEHVGSKALLNLIDRVKPKLVACGHIHGSYGIYKHNSTTIVNASVVNERYKLTNKPIMIEI